MRFRKLFGYAIITVLTWYFFFNQVFVDTTMELFTKIFYSTGLTVLVLAFIILCVVKDEDEPSMKKEVRCSKCDHKLKFVKLDPDKIFPDGYYHCKHCPNMYKPITVDVLKE